MSYEVLVPVESSSGDGPIVKFGKGPATPRNEYEELLLQAAVEAGFAKVTNAKAGD